MNHTAPGHSHQHSHRVASGRTGARLSWTLGLTLTYMFAELAGARLTNSLSLLADAGHMLSDAGALCLSLFALWMARRQPTPSRTFGYYRTEILAALANGALLVTLAVLIAREAIERVAAPPVVRGSILMIIAAGGLLVNVAGMLVLRSGMHESLNVRGAFMHVASDALGSVQVLLAGAAVQWLGWRWVDPIASLVIAVLIVISAWGLLREAVSVLMEGVPGHLNVDQVRDAIMSVRGVSAVHDLHVWSISSGFVALSAHVQVEAQADQDILWSVHQNLHDRFGIGHTTIQVERPQSPVQLGVRPSKPR
jgi:cobalt-zinc-cadmium efflux system protein